MGCRHYDAQVAQDELGCRAHRVRVHVGHLKQPLFLREASTLARDTTFILLKSTALDRMDMAAHTKEPQAKARVTSLWVGHATAFN